MKVSLLASLVSVAASQDEHVASTADETANPGFNDAGNGWCLDGNHDRIPWPPSWHSASVRGDGSAQRCEDDCCEDSSCIGYLTEDRSKCMIVKSSDSSVNGNPAREIRFHDSETRNHCWKKRSGDCTAPAPTPTPTPSPRPSPSPSPTPQPSGSFYRASGGDACNPSDRITDERECRGAASNQGFQYQSSGSDSHSPPGCYHDSGKVYFNTNWAASGHFSSSKGGLCNHDLKNFDLRLNYPGCGTEILTQGCGDCWAFSTVEAVSDRFCVIGEKITVSPQTLVSCDESKGSCLGGAQSNAYDYIASHGLQTCTHQCTSGCEPYGSGVNQCGSRQDTHNDMCHGCDRQCHDGSHAHFYKTSGRVKGKLDTDQETVKAQLRTHGSVTSGLSVYQNWAGWVKAHGADAVYDSHENSPHVGAHGIKISGYGVSHRKKYWLVQNSWGSGFADGGYIKILRNTTNQEENGLLWDTAEWAMPVHSSSFEAEPLPEVSPVEDESPITGGWMDADHTHEYFHELGHTLKLQVNAGGHFIGVTKAQSQVVAGVRVRLNIDTTHGPLAIETRVDESGNVLTSESVVLSSADQVVV